MKKTKHTLNAFEGALIGCFILLIFLLWQYGWSFPLIKPGNYLGPSGIYGFPVLFALIYLTIITVLYELLTHRSGVQSVIYTLFGYFYLDSIVQAHNAFTLYYPNQLYGDTTLLNTVLNIVSNMDVLIFMLLAYGLWLYHRFHRPIFPKLFGASLDYTQYFDFKRLTFLLIFFGFLWYIVYLDHPVSLFLPVTIYCLARKKHV